MEHAVTGGRVPALRRRAVNDAEVFPERDFVLYWMIASRRTAWNFALDRALDLADAWGKPLVVFEPLRAGYPWASDRFHRFVLDGMAENSRRFAAGGVSYFPYVEASPGAGKGLLAALSARACAVVTDDFSCGFLPRMVAAAGRQLRVRLEAVDSNGLLPVRAAPRRFERAVDFRRFLQNALPEHLAEFPNAAPLAPWRADAPASVARFRRDLEGRWPAASQELLAGGGRALAQLPIDHGVPPVDAVGGSAAGESTLRRFLERGLPRYGEQRNELLAEATSGLSPYLHFGFVSAHQILAALAEEERWNPSRLAPGGRGARAGWWGMSSNAEQFLDQLVTWRELGHNSSLEGVPAECYESVPEWARRVLESHAGDPRPYLYALSELESAATHDPLWNAAQRQLVREGRIHNYLRMLWGKKILEWAVDPRQAFSTMVQLNDKFALDGRDPNSYSGIAWCLGRYDRPWGPRRPIFGTVRYMSSANTARKLDVGSYLARYAGY
ncbi:MAG: deoxyribodipyrimidine photolyase [Acidobacteriota bacterium]